MNFKKDTVEKYTLCFNRDDIIKIGKQEYHLGGSQIIFTVDTETYTLSINGDWGNYCHSWYPTPNSETFKQLLCRLKGSRYYILGKLSSPTVIDWKKTRRNAIKDFFSYRDNYRDKEKVGEFLRQMKYVDENEVRFYDYMMEYSPDSFEGDFFVKDFPISAQLSVDIFINYLIPVLMKELEDKNV